MILTRFLYIKDEVELSLLTALLKKEDVELIYYWAYELYYSGFETELFDLLWKIYLDFYYEEQPYFETYFKKKYNLWKDKKDMKYVAYLLRNMYNLNAKSSVFMIRQKLNNCNGNSNGNEIGSQRIIYKFKPSVYPVWLLDYEKCYHKLLIAMHKRHFDNIWYYLKSLIMIPGSGLYDTIKMYLHIELDIELNNNNDNDNDEDITLHYLLAVIYRCLFSMNININININNAKRIYIMPKQEHLNYQLALEEEAMPLTKNGLVQIYNTLLCKRTYKRICKPIAEIDYNIGSFTLARWKFNEYEDFVKEQWFHWEYYAMGSPLWLARLQKHGGEINNLAKKIEFQTEQGEEDFYDLYAYELDELPKEVQHASMKPLLKQMGDVWYNYVFVSEPINSEPINSEPINSEPINSEPINSEPINSEPINLEPLWQWTY
jgi:hypothetical protein